MSNSELMGPKDSMNRPSVFPTSLWARGFFLVYIVPRQDDAQHIVQQIQQQ